MLPNMKTFENGWSNLSEYLRVVAIKLLEFELNSHHQINQFTLILNSVGIRCERGRFLVHSPFKEKSMIQGIAIT